MRNTALFILLLLVSTLCLQAQQADPGADRWRGPSGPSTIRGCLHASAGEYTITDDYGTVTAVTGNTAHLSRYVRHEVQITGKPTIRTLDTTVQNAASSVIEVPALEFKTVKLLGPTCGWIP